MKLLSFGHIPKWAGGRQSSGLANVIYQLALNMADCDSFEVALAATDVETETRKVDNLLILGCVKRQLCVYALLHPVLSALYLLNLLYNWVKYKSAINLKIVFLRGLFLRMSIDKFNPSIVHLHGVESVIYQHIVPKKILILCTVHGFLGNDCNIANSKNYRKMEYSLCHSHRINLLAFITKKLLNIFHNEYGNLSMPAMSIPNSYDDSVFKYVEPRKHSKLTIATIASISQNKGQIRVLEALKDAKQKIKYVCVGSGRKADIEELVKFSNKNGIDFSYLGIKTPSQIRDILSEVDYMLLPSSTEGFGLVYLESIACGVPVILPTSLPIVEEKDLIKSTNSILLEDSTVGSIACVLNNLCSYSFNHKEVSNSILDNTWQNVAIKYERYINSYECKN